MLSLVFADFQEDLNTISVTYSCGKGLLKPKTYHRISDPYCTFNHSEVTSKTIKFFPQQCEEVCGLLVFNSNTDLSEDELKIPFKNMIILCGGLRIENSTLGSLSFFNISMHMYFYCETCKLAGRIDCRLLELVPGVGLPWETGAVSGAPASKPTRLTFLQYGEISKDWCVHHERRLLRRARHFSGFALHYREGAARGRRRSTQGLLRRL